ncbi:hypothetical protein CROQUDRAFT_662314 [Cronartium quercuum f. sp. fusiforme G11]|uniref:Copper-fist domain-containing protein n=1 Tax=Cronartium quercuum f. sp. fusiforme G11 TaxID=708437 RepID=A0A9P6N9R9_9BASI|nr:hypothetical protein CROQUDRAFT_662314 [Cronartium quercuum f. sp. fusiforme G11]
MVLIDGKKFACAACVKGHRSTSCAHTDRELVEIGKKGRPPTQCAHCRELRRISKVHSKCMCGDRPNKRLRNPTVLPHGLNSLNGSPSIDFLNQISSTNNQTQIQPINSCSCSNGGQCCCSSPAHPSKGIRAIQRQNKSKQETVLPPSTSSSSPILQPENNLTIHNPVPSCCGPKLTTDILPLNAYLLYPSSSNHLQTSNSISQTLPSTHSNSISQSIPSTSSTIIQSSTSTLPIPSSNEQMPDPLFAPKTAGTALCFCGIHCPCPGCVLHDPLGLKFKNSTIKQPMIGCPTSYKKSEGCLAGLDLPTINSILNYDNNNSTNNSESSLQLPSMSETLDWLSNPNSTNLSCCGSKSVDDGLGISGLS